MWDELLDKVSDFFGGLDNFIALIKVISFLVIGIKYFLKEDKRFKFIAACLIISIATYIFLFLGSVIDFSPILLIIIIILSILTIISYIVYQPRGWEIEITERYPPTLNLDLAKEDGKADLKFKVRYSNVAHLYHCLKLEGMKPLKIRDIEYPQDYYDLPKNKETKISNDLILISKYPHLEKDRVLIFKFIIIPYGKPSWESGTEAIRIYSNYKKVEGIEVEYTVWKDI